MPFTVPPTVNVSPASREESVPAPVRLIERFALRVTLAVACSVPPLSVMFVAALPGAVPKLASLEIERAPSEIVVPPSKVFVPLSVNVPDPCLTRLPVPPTTPANAVFVASPVVSVLFPNATLPPVVPPPDSEPMVSLLDSVNTTPNTLASTTAPVSMIAEPPLRVRPPELTVVVPV